VFVNPFLGVNRSIVCRIDVATWDAQIERALAKPITKTRKLGAENADEAAPDLDTLRIALEGVAQRPSSQARHALRANIVLMSVFGGRSVNEVVEALDVTPPTVRKWRDRALTDPGLDTILDADRTGRPSTIGLRGEALIISLACQHPAGRGRLEAKMTQEIIKEEAAKEKLKTSRSTVQRVLARSELHPQREKYYLFTPRDRVEFTRRRDAIVDLYLRELPSDEVAVCMDEMSGLQVLKGLHPSRPALPGNRPGLKEHGYKRLGTRTMVSVMRPDTGELLLNKLYVRKAYKTAQTIEFLRELLKTLGESYRVVHLVWDNGTTHGSKEMKRFLASDEASRLRVYYTPVHSSWLNTAENFFSRFKRRYLGGRRFESMEAFEAHIAACEKDWNSKRRPVRWKWDPRKAKEAA
jgi:transposase